MGYLYREVRQRPAPPAPTPMSWPKRIAVAVGVLVLAIGALLMAAVLLMLSLPAGKPIGYRRKAYDYSLPPGR